MVSESRVEHVDYIGSWSAQKLHRLERYLEPYTLIMAKQAWCDGIHYIDAFAGSGRPKLRDTDDQRFINGSPRVALGLKNPFTSYTFIEQSEWRCQELFKLKDEFPGRTIAIRRGDCNDQLAKVLIPRIAALGRSHRGFVFLDPFGTNLEWSTVEAIARTRTLEVLINFPTSGLVRAFLHNRPNSLTDEAVSRMNRIWGSAEWREPLYEMRTNILGETEEIKKGRIGAGRLSELFVTQRLRQVFTHVSEPLIMTNSNGAPLYTLIHAGPNETGAKIAAQVFGKPDLPKRRKRESSTDGFQALPLLDISSE